MIAFVGSVFSPYYAYQRRRYGNPCTDPAQHVSINAALYGGAGHRWAMTERSGRDLSRQRDLLRIGPSSMAWDGATLELVLDEITVPWPTRLRGHVSLSPICALNTAAPVMLDEAGCHFWQPVAPVSRVKVNMQSPDLQWQGTAYWDANFGSEPLENAFSGWHWSRTHQLPAPGSGAAESIVMYDVDRRTGLPLQLARKFRAGAGGELVVTDFNPPPLEPMRSSAWRIPRLARSDAPGGGRILATLEDGPFYARSQIETSVDGMRVTGVHESLSLDRFRSTWVQALLPFKMPRRG